MRCFGTTSSISRSKYKKNGSAYFEAQTTAWSITARSPTIRAYPESVRRIIYTTNAIEALNRRAPSGRARKRALPE